MTTLEIQQALLAEGFDPGGLDGKLGPKTRAAIRAYQQAHGLTVDGIAGPKTQGSLQARKNGATTPAAPAADTFQAKYPQFAWAFNDPEVKTALDKAVAGKWGPEELQGEIQKTNWWKNKTNAERDWLQTLATNPAEATRQLNNYDSITKYIAMASAYGQTVSFEAAARQVDRVVRGEIAPDALEQELRINAKALFPYLAQTIDAGGNIAQVFEPIKNAVAQVLGENPANITLSDPKYRSLLTSTDGGTQRLATEDEVFKRLKTDPQFNFRGTQNGRDEGFAAYDAVMTGFGFNA